MSDSFLSATNQAVAFSGQPKKKRKRSGKLNAAARKKLPGKDFAGPGRSYPDEDASHARDALARVSEYGSPKVKAEVRKNVAKKYPGMAVKRLRKAGKISDKQASKRGLAS